ncbi:unnamed protein product, partial [Ilex paraguariensis]
LFGIEAQKSHRMGNSESITDDSHDDFQHQPPSYAGSSMETNYQRRQQPSYIADNFNSVEE